MQERGGAYGYQLIGRSHQRLGAGEILIGRDLCVLLSNKTKPINFTNLVDYLGINPVSDSVRDISPPLTSRNLFLLHPYLLLRVTNLSADRLRRKKKVREIPNRIDGRLFFFQFINVC